MVRASLRRGKPGEGWWASDMTDLGVVAELTLASDRVEAILVVDVRGQLLSSGDRAFWQSEAKSASAYLSGVSEIVDCRMAEVLRGQSVSRSIRSTARWSGALVFIGLSILGFFAVRTFPEVAQVFEAIRDMLF